MKKMQGRQSLVIKLFAIFAAVLVHPAITYAAPALSIYGSLPGFEMAALSKSGDHVALVGTVKGERRLIVMDKDAKLVMTAPLGDIKVRGLYWAGDDCVLVYKSDAYALSQNRLNMDVYFNVPKTELFSMIVTPLNGKQPWRVFSNRKSIALGVKGFYGISERNGQYFGYFGGTTYDGGVTQNPYLTTTAPVLYEVDLQDQSARKVASRLEADGRRHWIVGQDGEVNATLDYFSKDGSWTIRNGANEKIASGNNSLGRIGLVGLGITPNTLVYSEGDNEDGEPHWFEVPLSGGEAKPIFENIPVNSAVIDPRSRQIMGYKLGSDAPSYKFFNAYQQKVVAATFKAFPNLLVHLQDWNDQFNKLLVMTEGANDPQTWWLVDIKTGQATQLGSSYAVHSRDVAPMRMIQYKAGDGLDINAVLTLPAGMSAKNLPLIVLPHSGPATYDYPGFDWWAQAFASRGYAVLQPNFRGSSGYGAAFEEAGNGEWGRKMQTDLSDGVAYLADQGIADPKRTCIVGASYGGYAALAGLTLQHGIYRCAVSVSGISDLEKLSSTVFEESVRRADRWRALEHELGSEKNLHAVSPINFASTADAPVLLIHGKDDIVVRYEQSDVMANALRKAGKPVEFVTLPGEDHWLSKSATRLAMLEAAVAFVEKYNPASPSQK